LNGVRVDAIVGLDVLARASFSIDYQNRLLTIAPDVLNEPGAAMELAWPFITVRMAIAGASVRLLLDTGSADLVLFKSRMPDALERAPWKGDKAVRYASGAARLLRLELRHAGLGPHVWDTLQAWSLDRALDNYPASLDGVLACARSGAAECRSTSKGSSFAAGGDAAGMAARRVGI
jgi:hypothetical protein